MEQTCESMDKNRIEGARTGRVGNRRPYADLTDYSEVTLMDAKWPNRRFRG